MQNIAHALDGAVVTRESCPSYHRAVELIGKRWNGVILQVLLGGPARFSELRGAISGITDTMLSQRLKELEDAGLVAREILENRPIVVQYGLTDIGNSLSPILNAIALWSNEWSNR
jgi:DNA-binding HxlR family transcriptional regulator